MQTMGLKYALASKQTAGYAKAGISQKGSGYEQKSKGSSGLIHSNKTMHPPRK